MTRVKKLSRCLLAQGARRDGGAGEGWRGPLASARALSPLLPYYVDTKCMSLKYELASEPLHVYVK